MLNAILCVAALVSIAGPATAKPLTYDLPEETAVLRPGAGMDAAQSNCVSCHSADYIAMQPPNRGKGFWEAEVTKMMKVYGARIEPTDTKAIIDYLAQTY